MLSRRLAIFQRFITIEVEFAYHDGDDALLKASGRANVLRGAGLGCPRTRRARGQDSVGIYPRTYCGPQTAVYCG